MYCLITIVISLLLCYCYPQNLDVNYKSVIKSMTESSLFPIGRQFETAVGIVESGHFENSDVESGHRYVTVPLAGSAGECGPTPLFGVFSVRGKKKSSCSSSSLQRHQN